MIDRTLLFLVLLSPALVAQQPEPAVDVVEQVVTEARVRECVTWLAADDRNGRDTPSAGLQASAEWLADRFEAAGLGQVRKGSWFYDYSVPGVVLDSEAVALELERTHRGEQGQEKVTCNLKPGADLRLWRTGDLSSGENERCSVALRATPALRSLFQARAGRRPIVLEVAEDHPFWVQATGTRQVLGRPVGASRPIFLAREGVLPPPPSNGREPTWIAEWSTAEPERVSIPLTNVMALVPGSELREQYVVVSAHFDHLGVCDPIDGDGICNGADVGATGATAALLVAEALAKMPAPRRSVLFVCFSGSERGMLGSRAFVELPPVPREHIVANVNLAMLGRPEAFGPNKVWITGAARSDLAAVAAPALARRGVELVEHPMASLLHLGSDDASFVRRGIVAHSVYASSIHADYHRPGDEVDKLDIAHLTAVIRGLCDFVRELADHPSVPQWNASGRKVVERFAKKEQESRKQ